MLQTWEHQWDRRIHWLNICCSKTLQWLWCRTEKGNHWITCIKQQGSHNIHFSNVFSQLLFEEAVYNSTQLKDRQCRKHQHCSITHWIKQRDDQPSKGNSLWNSHGNCCNTQLNLRKREEWSNTSSTNHFSPETCKQTTARKCTNMFLQSITKTNQITIWTRK